MRRNRTQNYVDEANLQADVMRFMAIVAFCLVAILAIVRNVEPTLSLPPPPPDQVRLQQVDLQSQAAAAASPAPAMSSMLPSSAPTFEPAPAPPPVLHPYTAAVPEPRPVIPQQDTKPTAQPEPIRQTRSEQSPETKAVAESFEPDPSPPAGTGLALRFASDGDFLRLLSKGTVKLYAISGDDYQIYDVTRRFVPINPPEQYYEVVAATVPPIIADMLKGASVTWAVGLPATIEQQITAHIEHASSGELLINRFEQVHHVSAH